MPRKQKPQERRRQCRSPHPDRQGDRPGKSLLSLKGLEPIAHPFMQISAWLWWKREGAFLLWGRVRRDGSREPAICRIARREPNYPFFKE